MFIRMVGEFEVRGAAGIELTPRGAKSRALLALLARTPGHRRPRRWLEARLWSDRGQEQASGSLRQALTELRKALGPLACNLTSDRDCVALGGLRTDLDADPAGAAAQLAQGREFLEGIDVIDPAFNRWLVEERQRVAAELGRIAPAPTAPFSLRLGELPQGTEAALARDLAAAIARLTAEYLLGEGQRGRSGDLLPGGLNLLVEGDWSEDRAYLKVRLVDQVNHRTMWSQRLTASRSAAGRGETAPVVFEATDGQLM